MASEQGPSCSRIDQLPSLKIFHIRFTNDLSRKRLFPEISSFSKTSDFSGILSKHPKSFSAVSKQVEKRFASIFPRSLSAADMLRLGTLIRKENKNDVKFVVESFDIAKKEWKTVTEDYFEIEEMHFAEGAFRKAYMAKCSTYPFKNKQWVIKKLNQSTVTDLNVFKESSESLTRKSVQMNTLAQYMAKSFREAAEKANISFHFGEIFHYNSVYYGKISSIQSITIEELIPGTFVKYINNDGSQCVILLRNECHDKADAFVQYTYEKSQRNLVVLDIQGVGYSLCDPEVASKENKIESEEHYFCFGHLSERAILNFSETHVCNRFCRALGLQPPNAE